MVIEFIDGLKNSKRISKFFFKLSRVFENETPKFITENHKVLFTK